MSKTTKTALIVLAIVIPIIILFIGGLTILGVIIIGNISNNTSSSYSEKNLIGTWYDSSKKLNISLFDDKTIEFYTDDKTTVYMKGTYTMEQDLKNEKGDEYIITVTAYDRVASGKKYTDKYTTQFSIITEDYQNAVMMNVSTYNLYYLTKISGTANSSGVSNELLSNTSTYSKSDVEKDLRNYITSKYGIQLNEKCEIGQARDGYDYGYFTPVNDPSYLIQISKKGNTYTCSYNENHIKVRKELMDEITKYKGKNTVNTFLVFYHNGDEDGPIHKEQSSVEFLSYVVFYDSSLNMDEQIKQDYKIVKKADELLKKYSGKNLDRVMIHYIDNSKVLNKNWVTDSNAGFTSLSLAPNYITGSYVDSEKIPKYSYSAGLDRKYNIELKDMTENQFVEYVKNQIKDKN